MIMDNIWSMMDIIFAGAGAYMLYAWILMKKTGEIKNFLAAKQRGGYPQVQRSGRVQELYGAPKMLVFGITALVYGGYGLVNSYVFSMPMPVYWAVMAGFFAVLVWFSVQSRKSVELFW